MLDDYRQRRARRLIRAIGFAIAAVAMVTACDGGSGGLDELRDSAVEVLTAAGITVEREPAIQRSKDIEYITTDGTLAGDLESVVAEVARAMEAGGWEVKTSEAVGSAAGQRAPAYRVIATRDDIAIRALVTGVLGTTTAPAGTQWVQLSVARHDDRLAWTTTS